MKYYLVLPKNKEICILDFLKQKGFKIGSETGIGWETVGHGMQDLVEYKYNYIQFEDHYEMLKFKIIFSLIVKELKFYQLAVIKLIETGVVNGEGEYTREKAIEISNIREEGIKC